MKQNFITVTNLDIPIKTFRKEPRNKNQGTTRTKITRRNAIIAEINNHERKYCYKKKYAVKESENNITEDIIYNKFFIAKTSNQKYNSKTFITNSSATSHMLNW